MEVFRPLDAWMYGRYWRVACISKAAAVSLVRWVPQVRDKVVVVPNGVDLSRFGCTRLRKNASLPWASADLTVVSVGRLEAVKDHETLVKAVAMVPGVHAIIAGKGPLLNHLRSLAEASDASSRIHFLGVRADIPEILAGADVYVQASRWEGFGLSVVEAMASGLPVICSRVPGLEEVVGTGGLFFEPGNHLELANLLVTVMNSDESTRRRLSVYCLNRSRMFDIDRTADQYAVMYEESMRLERP